MAGRNPLDGPTTGRAHDLGANPAAARRWTDGQGPDGPLGRSAHGPKTSGHEASVAADLGPVRPAARLLDFGRRCDRWGRLDEAIGAYEAAIEAAQVSAEDAPILAEALRRLAVIFQRRGESDAARGMCERSYEVATRANAIEMQAEALNTLGGLELVRERLDDARGFLERALELSEQTPELLGRIEQNFGILWNIRGNRATALDHYHRSLQAFLAARNEQGCAVAYHNLGMISADEKRWEEADRYFEQGRRTAQLVGDDHLRALCLMNRVEVLIALRRFDAAQLAAETALSIFEELRAPAGIADVNRMLGVVFRETGRLNLAQSRLELAVELAKETGSPVSNGEALYEAGRLHRQLGHLDVAVDCLVRACRQFAKLPGVLQGPELAEGEYPNFVQEWGELVRALDPRVADHADRVAALAVAISQALGLTVQDQVTVRLGAQLHELGVLPRPASPVDAGSAASDRSSGTSPAGAAELLLSAECFDRIAPLVRGVCQLADGSEDPASGDTDLVGGRIVALADAFDRLVYGDGSSTLMRREDALAALAKDGNRWGPPVYDALVNVTAAAGIP